MSDSNTTAIAVLDAFLQWLETSAFANFRDCLEFEAVDIDAYEDCFTTVGFSLPASLKHFVKERGLLGICHVSDEAINNPRYQSTGVQMLGAQRLRNYSGYLVDFYEEGVPNAEHWFLIATQHDLEPAYALDKRFGKEGEYELGLFHQDQVINSPVGDAERLPCHWNNFAAWLDDFLLRIRTGFEDGDQNSILAQIDDFNVKRKADSDKPTKSVASFTEASNCPTFYTGSDFSKNFGYNRPWVKVFRNTTDLAIVEQIITKLRVPALRDFKVSSPRAYVPAPVDLLWRLAHKGRWGRLGVLLWVHEQVTPPPAPKAAQAVFQAAIEELKILRDASLEKGARRKTLRSLAAWQSQGGDVRRYALALCYSFSSERPDADTINRAMFLLLSFCPPAFDQDVLWQKLEAIVLRDPNFIPAMLRAPVLRSTDIKQLLSFLKEHEGPQRATMAAVRHHWATRFENFASSDKVEATKLLLKFFKSKKLKEELSTLLDRLK